jgi:hypothetical protein
LKRKDPRRRKKKKEEERRRNTIDRSILCGKGKERKKTIISLSEIRVFITHTRERERCVLNFIKMQRQCV